MTDTLKSYELDYRRDGGTVEQATALGPDGLEAAINFARGNPGVRVVASRRA